MTDHDADSLSRPNSPQRALGRSSIPRSSGSYGSYGGYGTGESSTPAGFPYDTSIDAVTFRSSSPHNSKEPSSDLRSVESEEPEEHEPKHDAHRQRRSNKPRPSSGFLLPNSIVTESSKSGSKHRGNDRRKSRIPVDNRRGKSPLSSSGGSSPLESTNPYSAFDRPKRTSAHSAPKSTGKARARDDRPHSEVAERRTSRIPSLRPSSAPFDVDSTRIVSMALDLSESRRLASRRNISGPIPPGLAQLPENTPGRSLTQHLQQQRRSSRNISPRADTKLLPRIAPASRVSSSLQPAYDHDGSYTYHFSSSTLHRAQRAKEYLELMAQYRRVLLFLTPLKQETRSRPSTSSIMTSADSTDPSLNPISSSQNRILGRAYNPVQYIRNRKIRTRERKTIDGEAQGFGDVLRVTDWIDEVATYAAASPMAESPKLPPFPAADECMRQQVTPSNLPRPVSSLNKSKRPRFEWSLDPADMLADIYWLEQGDNKFLIEDRHYAKIYTPKPAAPQPTTLATEQSKPGLVVSVPKETHDGDGPGIPDNGIAHSIKADVETTLTSTRDRARQKLQDLKGMHHKHSSSIYSHHDFLRFRRGSSSDSSENESDRRRRGRTGTLSASGQDLLEKQMNDMLAKENQDELKQSHQTGTDLVYLKPQPAPLVTPLPTSQSFSRQHSRQGSLAETVEHMDKALDKHNQTPSIPSGRTSLEVPGHLYGSSVDLDSSRPGLSDLAPRGRRHGYVPAIGMDLSPNASRPSSPARNPFLKVKNMFRDHEDRENDDKIITPTDPMRTISISAATKDVTLPPERSRSKSSTREYVAKVTSPENAKSHRTIGSMSLRPDEQVGLRTIFKGGAKLDDMIRGGVSKMTDLIFKKDSDGSSVSSGDESDPDDWRGRHRGSALLTPEGSSRHHQRRHSVKNYLDIMPNFKSAADSVDKPASFETDGTPAQVVSPRPRRSQRFEQLKPPRINVKVPPAPSGFEKAIPRNINFEVPEIDTHSRDSSRPVNRPRQTSKELQNVLSMHRAGPPVPYTGDATRASEHRNWTVPDRASLSQNGLISRREVARLRALILCSGIKAMEISRRASEPHPLFGLDSRALGLPFTEIDRFVLKEPADFRVPQTQLFPTAARILSTDINRSLKMIETSASKFSSETAPALQQQVDAIYTRIAMDFMDMTRRAVDEADDVSHDIVDSQRLKVKSVVDTMDKMLRRRRRRFRYVRRAGWLAVEWVLVGFMWYVWFIVMIARIILGVGRGAVSVVRWLLWL
ncbi:hypothetical protein F4861DRAFT_527681 [Xylaria intraflava]|nr:hypothetical protein F4861DRAFT_527681 [Xylaria intraflava]